MPTSILQRIRAAIFNGDYDLTQPAVEEMAEDGLTLIDVEHAVLNGGITKTETDDERGTRFTIRGWSADAHVEVGVVGRFTEVGIYLIITAYQVTRSEE